MNYIKKLELENSQLKNQIEFMNQQVADFRAFLMNSGKFQGRDIDGSRKDWISTGDVLMWISEVNAAHFRNE